MRFLLAIAAVVLICGCTTQQGQTPAQYVCPQGQVVTNPSDCNPPTTTTTATTTTTTLESSTTTSTTISLTTTTTSPPITTTTLCEEIVRGYLQVNDIDDRCHNGYKYRIDPGLWDCTTTGAGCKIGFIVTKPDGTTVNTFTKADGTGGLQFEVDGIKVELGAITTDKSLGFPRYSGLLWFPQ